MLAAQARRAWDLPACTSGCAASVEACRLVPLLRAELLLERAFRFPRTRWKKIFEGQASTMLFLTAKRTRSAEDDRPSFRMTDARCVSTVFRLMFNVLAIILLDDPSAIRCTIVRSRLVMADFTLPDLEE